jgi:hypothetical protein
MSHMRLWVLLALCGLFSLFLLWPGCGNGEQGQMDQDQRESTSEERPIHLETVGQGVHSEYGRFAEVPVPEDAPPECMVITDNEEYQRLLSISSFQETLGEMDFEKDIAIAALQGPKNTGGYAISIVHASQTGMEVRVEVEVVKPDPGSMTVQVLTSPYHVVKADRSGFDPSGELIFLFVDQENNRIDQQSATI